MANKRGWIGVDFDKTLAHHRTGRTSLGTPILPMVARVKRFLSDGRAVKVVTARPKSSWGQIGDWTEKHIGRRLPVTNSKTPSMKVLYDDRVRQVEPNTGRLKNG